MNAKTSVVVIAAGLGGIATVARLARQGYQVTVLEKNAEPGAAVENWSVRGIGLIQGLRSS